MPDFTYSVHQMCAKLDQVRYTDDPPECDWHGAYSDEVQEHDEWVNCICPKCKGPTVFVRVAE